MKTVIFDLDGTLADITKRREMSTKENGKIDWDIFFTPENIWFDTPNEVVIQMAQMLSQKNRIVIFSGRSKGTKSETKRWLDKFDVPYDVIKMRPTSKDWMDMPDRDWETYNTIFLTQHLSHLNYNLVGSIKPNVLRGKEDIPINLTILFG